MAVGGGDGAEEGVEEGAEVVGEEGFGALGGGVDEDEGAVVGGEFEEAVDKGGGHVGAEEVGVFVEGWGGDVALQHGYVDAAWGYCWSGG